MGNAGDTGYVDYIRKHERLFVSGHLLDRTSLRFASLSHVVKKKIKKGKFLCEYF